MRLVGPVNSARDPLETNKMHENALQKKKKKKKTKTQTQDVDFSSVPKRVLSVCLRNNENYKLFHYLA